MQGVAAKKEGSYDPGGARRRDQSDYHRRLSCDHVNWTLGKSWIVAMGLRPDVVQRIVIDRSNTARPSSRVTRHHQSRTRHVWSDLDIMRLHVEAEFTHDAAGDLVSTNEPIAAVAPRFCLGQTALGHIVRFRCDVPSARRRALEHALAATEQIRIESQPDKPLDPAPFERILAGDAPLQHTSVGIAFRFPPSLRLVAPTRTLKAPADAVILHPDLAAWAPDIQLSPPLVAFVLDGQAVAVCGSVRITSRACEAGVETAAPFRGRGYGQAVVAAWATAVRALGVEPLYSTSWQNESSRGVARALGLVAVGRDLHVT